MTGADGHVPGLDEQTVVTTAGQMRALGRQLAGLLQAGDLVLLSGPLGAGKTTLTQGIGAGLGVRGQVTSPTFVIARVHPSLGSGPDLVHADAYRLGSRAEVDDLDLDADLATSVTVVEWGEGLVEDLAPGFLAISLRAADSGAAGSGAADPWAADHGPADPGAAGHGSADHGAAGHGSADHGPAGHGSADHGSAGSGSARAASGPGLGAALADDGDQPRIVRVRGSGARWQDPAAAAAVRSALSVA